MKNNLFQLSYRIKSFIEEICINYIHTEKKFLGVSIFAGLGAISFKTD